jgi:hypothetical protein
MSRSDSPRASRRNILMALGGGAVALLAVGTPLLSPRTARRAAALAARTPLAGVLVPLDLAEQAQWTALAGSRFVLGGGVTARLEGIEPFAPSGAPAGTGRAQPFAAVFALEGGAAAAGDLIHTLSHPDFGTFDLFLSESAAGGGRLVAYFN